MKKLSEFERQMIRCNWAAGGCTAATLAQKYGCSAPTIGRVTKGIKKGGAATAIGEADDVITQAALDILSKPTQRLDDAHFYGLMLNVAESLLKQATELPCKSGSEAEIAGARTLVMLRQLYPLTMEQAAEWLVTLPDFDPKEFAQVLISRWRDKKRGA